MSGYYYLDDPESELGYTPVPEDEMVGAILSIAQGHGLNITDKMILNQIQKKESKSKNAKKKTNLYIDGTNLFAGQHELFGPNKHLSFSFLIQEIKKLVPVDSIFFYASYMNQKNRTRLTEGRKRLIAAEALYRFSLEMAYKADKAFVLNFSNRFNIDRKLPRQMRIVSIKKPRMINIRGR